MAPIANEVGSLDEATAALRDAAASLDRGLALHTRCPPIFRLRAGEAAADILGFLPFFREAHLAASAEVAGDIRGNHEIVTLLAGGRPPDVDELETPLAAKRLIIAYKALYFFIRAYQDRLYTVLSLVIQPDQRPGERMEKAFERRSRDRNPVYVVLGNRLPAYVEWFPTWRDQRNRVKDGVSFSTAGPVPEGGLHTLGIRFNEFTPDGGISVDLSQAVQLSDVVKALELSAALATVVADEIPPSHG